MRRILKAVVAVVPMLLLGVGCGGEPPHETNGGPLGGAVKTGGRIGAVPPPGYKPVSWRTWSVVDGNTILCTISGDPIVLDSVAYDVRVGSKSAIRAKVRSITGEESGSGIKTPIATLNGTFGHYQYGSTTWDLAGTMGPVRGHVVKVGCKAAYAGSAFDELMIQIPSGSNGTWVKSFVIRYHVGDVHYRVHVNWSYALMGTTVKELCSDPDNPFHADPDQCPQNSP